MVVEKLETISFRGRRKQWLKFVYTTKIRDEKNVWGALNRMINDYLKNKYEVKK